MKPRPTELRQQYQTALRSHLKAGTRASLDSARGLGSEALAAGLQTLDLAKLHERTLVEELLPACLPHKRPSLIRRAGMFFAAAVTPIEKVQRSAKEASAYLNAFIETLSQRTVELAASNLELRLEVKHRLAVEKELKKSERHYSLLLERSDRLQERLRHLSRQILFAQEEERKKISRELHDVIAQTLTGINLRLASLKKEAGNNTKGLDHKIALTQRLVEHSVNIVHQFARELRPAVLDDLGLIPALHSFMKMFSARTGVRSHLSTVASVDNLSIPLRTTLFRVAQEALINVGRHAKATNVTVTITKREDSIRMEIRDNGKSFQAEHVLDRRGTNRLGLLGMKERLEMVGGRFKVESVAGMGTSVSAEVPTEKPVPEISKSKPGTENP